MNERIQELKRQASMWCDQNIPGEFDENTGGYGSHWEEKFAELIVQECVDLFEVEWGEEKLTGNDVGYVVKKHFGVEE